MAIIEIHVHQEADPEISQKLDQVLAALAVIQQKETAMSKETDDLVAAVAAEDTVIGSILTLVNGIPALLAAKGVDATVVAQVTADINAQKDAMAAAVLANTPAAPAAPVAPDAPAPTP